MLVERGITASPVWAAKEAVSPLHLFALCSTQDEDTASAPLCLVVNLCPCGIAPAARSGRTVGVLGVPPSLPCPTSLLTGASLGCVAP